MALSDLPTLYDMSDPASNLAFDLTPLDRYRLTFGEGLIPGAIGARFGYVQYGWLGAILGAFAGYMAPLPTVGLIMAKAGSDAVASGALTGLSRRRYRRRSRR